MYFARMKRDNKVGPRVLHSLPNPYRLSIGELGRLSGRTDIAVIDARVDRESFMAGHLAGSICAPFNKAFNTVVGSFVEENTPIFLIIQEAHVDAAVRDLVRIGLDDIVAYATPEMIDRYRDAGGDLAQIPELSIDDVTTLSKRDDVLVFDVRNATEHEAARVPGSFNIAHTRLWVRRDEVPAGKTLAVHCMTGGRSAASASLL
jgi:hydroxyacylglutathione hydrolase